MENTKLRSGDIIAFILIGITVLMLLIGSLSCNSPKRAERQAAKLFSKADNKDHITVLNKCSEIAPPVSSTRDSFIYKQGDPVVFQDTVMIHDTVNGKEIVYITQKVKVTDTIYRTKEVTTVDRAKEYALAGQLEAEHNAHMKDNADNKSTITKLKTERNYFIWAACIGWGLILLRLIYVVWLKKYFAVGKLIK